MKRWPRRVGAGMMIVGLGLVVTQFPSSAKVSTKGFSVSAVVKPAATIALSTNFLTWTTKNSLVRITFGTSNVKSGTPANGKGGPGNKTFTPADNGPIRVTGGIRTSSSGGAGSIVVLSPGDIAGQGHSNHIVAINDFVITCSGNGNAGSQPTYAPALTPLQAHAFSPCATWGPRATARLNFSLNVLLNIKGTPPDTYTSGGFVVIATTT